mmetsp:Transcript_6561/g.15179  ORF Transcript_6561/g.15179 Transcript_6561/m.15179 type:complete len:295 (+) Transcript_6561:39-923(+)
MAEQGIADAQCSHVHVWVEQRAASWPRSMCAHPLCLPASAVQHISTAQHSTVLCCTLRFRTPTLSLLALPWGPGAAIPFRDWNQASWPVAGLWFTVWFAKTECQDQTGVVYVSFNTKDSPQATHWCMPGAPFLLPAPAAVMGTRVGGDALAHPLSPRAMASYLNRSRSSPGRVPVAPRSTSESRPSHAPAASPVASWSRRGLTRGVCASAHCLRHRRSPTARSWPCRRKRWWWRRRAACAAASRRRRAQALPCPRPAAACAAARTGRGAPSPRASPDRLRGWSCAAPARWWTPA